MPRTVFVLGAGFTKAFLPAAPLLVDTYDIEKVISKHRGFLRAEEILQGEAGRRNDGKIDIERLLTRLEGLPFDTDEALAYFASIKRDVHKLFLDRLEQAKSQGIKYHEELRDFAYHCLVHQASCVTFNYDDVLDQAMHEVGGSVGAESAIYWHPNTGYGFYIPLSADCIGGSFWAQSERSATLIHKLHGSINWRTKLGFHRPYPIDALVHHDNWSFSDAFSSKFIASHLTDDVFVIPPILVKTSLQEPIVKRIWEHARKALIDADRVIFIGYSCPITDLAADFLFAESLKDKRDRISIVDSEKAGTSEVEAFRDRYKRIIPSLNNDQFHFAGAIQWLNEFLPARRDILSRSEGQKAAKNIIQFLRGEKEPNRSAQGLCSKIGSAEPSLYEQVIQKLLNDGIIIRNARGNLLIRERPDDPNFRSPDA